MKRSTLGSTGRAFREACHGSIVIRRRDLSEAHILPSWDFFCVLVWMASIEVLTLPILCGTRALIVVTLLFFFQLNSKIAHKNVHFSAQPACSRLSLL